MERVKVNYLIIMGFMTWDEIEHTHNINKFKQNKNIVEKDKIQIGWLKLKQRTWK